MLKSKEEIIEFIKKSGSNGETLTHISGTRKISSPEYILTKQLLNDLVAEKKIEKKHSRYYIIGVRKHRKVQSKYITRSELEEVIQQVYRDIATLKAQIDRAFEYVDEVFLSARQHKPSVALPTEQDMQIAYDNVNQRENAGDSVPLPDFKRELKKMGFKFSDEEINKKLLDMDKAEIIYLQQANAPDELEEKEKGIQTDRGFLFYITWIKRF